jgi:hypothetical protein
MPRRRPSTLRASDKCFAWHRERYSKIGRISGAAQAHVIRLERARFGPGAVASALAVWTAVARTPAGQEPALYSPGCGEPSCCPAPGDQRDVLERFIRAMPIKSARELRTLVRILDDEITRHPVVALSRAIGGRWWAPDV